MLDEQIDRAARELTAGEPSPRLRHAVRSRLEQRPRAWHLRIWVPAVVGVALLVIVAVGVTVADRPNDPTLPAAPQIAMAPPAAPPLNEAMERPERRTERSERPERAERRVLLEIDPLVIEPLQLPQLAVGTSSGVMPIEIDGLQIEPLRIE